MGLFSRKKKLSKEERKIKDQAYEELKKLKEQQKITEQQEQKRLERSRSENPSKTDELDKKYMASQEEHQNLLDQIKKGHEELEIVRQKDQEEFNKDADSLRGWENKRLDIETEDQTTCWVEECSEKVDFFSGKKCKFCQKRFCFGHIQLEKHECPGPTIARNHLRKTWLRKYNVNISTGKYIIVCDQCGFVSEFGSLIETAGEDRERHVEQTNCDPKNVWLEEDLSNQKPNKNIDLEKVVPIDRTFWVCSHCRPPRKFTERTEYISHHYFHS